MKTKQFDCFVGARCEWCGAECQRGNGVVLEVDQWSNPNEYAVACARGHGCRRRRPEHTRVTVTVDSAGRCRSRTQVLYGGWWYVASELAALAELETDTVVRRIQAGWTAEDIVAPRRRRDRAQNRRWRAALRAAGGNPAPKKRPRSQAERSLARERTERTRQLAAELGISYEAAAMRVMRKGFDGALSLGPSKRRVA